MKTEFFVYLHPKTNQITRMTTMKTLMTAVLLTAGANCVMAQQPILTGFHADPEVLYSTKTKKYYIYSTTDGTPGWGGHDFSVFSSKNLVDWKDEGKMLDVKGNQVKWATGNAWAPCIIEKKGKYYFYFSAHNPQSKRKEIGVAVSRTRGDRSRES